MDLLQLREKEIFEILKTIKKFSFVVIGGYAVNSYTLPRFSVDCDVVIKDKGGLDGIEKELLKKGYVKINTNHPNLSFHDKFLRYEKTLDNKFKASVDILFNEILDRQTNSIFNAGWVFENSSLKLLKGKTITDELRIRIINLDALLVMKMISCRSTDIRDIFMLAIKINNLNWIKQEINKRCKFNDRFTKIKEKIISKKFKDDLQGVYGYIDERIFDKHKKAILGLEK